MKLSAIFIVVKFKFFKNYYNTFNNYLFSSILNFILFIFQFLNIIINLFTVLEGYIKSSIRLLRYQIKDEIIHYGIGSITNGEHKVEVRVRNFPEDIDEFTKGDHVRIEGLLKFTSKLI